MVDILRPDYGQAWASEGEKLAPAQDKVAMGWVQEMMPFQYENFLQARQDEALLYLLQKGVPEYSATQEYTANKSIVQYQGDLYLSTATVTGVLPTVTTSWRKLSPMIAANGSVSVAGGGTGATTVAQARANLGLGDASTATLPTSTGVVIKGSGNALISRILTGTSGDIVITNPDGVAGNINIGVGSNVVKSNQDSSWTSKAGITLPKGSSGERGVEVPGKIRYNTGLQKFEGYNGTSWNALGAASEVEITTLSGDGATTVFTLNTPAFSEASTDVYIGGIWQNKGTYSVSGTQITFSEAPTPGTENVQVTSRRVVDLGLARASQISLEDSANLITATTVEGALREIVETSGTITASAEWESVPSHSNPKLDLQAKALVNRTELLRSNQKHTLMVYATLAEAEAAAATLPDGQVVHVESEKKRYHVTDGELVFDGLLGVAVVETVNSASRSITPSDSGKYLRFVADGTKTAEFSAASNFVGGEEIEIANRANTGQLLLNGIGVQINPIFGGTLQLAPGNTVKLKSITSAVFDVLYGSTSSAGSLPSIVDDNATFNDEGDTTTGWTASNGALSSSESYLRLTKTSAGTNASMTKTVIFTPDNRDFLLYGKVRASSMNTSDMSAIWFLNGSKEFSFWLGSGSGGGSSGQAIGAASIIGTTGSSTLNRLRVANDGELSYATDAVEFALQFDSKFGQMVCWFKESDGRWKFRGSVACDWFAPSPLQIQLVKGSEAPTASWIEFDYLTLCKPNLVAIGDSICAGATLFNPNRTLGLTNDNSTWIRHAVLYPNLRNNLIVNKGVGSQTSAQILARIADATGESPRVVFLHASSNDEAASIPQATRTSNIQNTVNAIKAAGQQSVLLNAMYGTSGGSDNLPTPDLRNYMTTWWNTYMQGITDVDVAINTMQPIIASSGFMQTALTQSDGIHPTPTGYQMIGEYITSFE